MWDVRPAEDGELLSFGGGDTYQQDCCWPSGKPNEASRNPPPSDCSLYGLALASSSSLPAQRLDGLTSGGYGSGERSQVLPNARHSNGSWYDHPNPNLNDHVQPGVSLSPIAGTNLAQVYSSGGPSQPRVTSTGLTPYLNLIESPREGQESSTTPQQLDSIFSGIDFSEVSLPYTPSVRLTMLTCVVYASIVGGRLSQRHLGTKHRSISVIVRSPRHRERPHQYFPKCRTFTTEVDLSRSAWTAAHPLSAISIQSGLVHWGLVTVGLRCFHSAGGCSKYIESWTRIANQYPGLGW